MAVYGHDEGGEGSRHHARMRLETFAREVLLARDLDPVSYTVRRAVLGQEMTEAWLAAYWVLLDPGAACYVADTRYRWSHLEELVRPDALPDDRPWARPLSRRRFRGVEALQFLDALRKRCGSLQGVARFVRGTGTKHARDVIRQAREIGFDRATADLAAVHVRKVLGDPLRFGEAWALRGDEVQAAARLLWEEAGIEPRERDRRVWVRYALARLRRAFGSRMLPQDSAALLRRWVRKREGGDDVTETSRLKGSLQAWVPFTTLASRLLWVLPRPRGEE